MMIGDVGEGPTSYGEVLRTREDIIAELGADKAQFNRATQALNTDSDEAGPGFSVAEPALKHSSVYISSPIARGGKRKSC
jgi:hypothetical protein